jgi:GTPase
MFENQIIPKILPVHLISPFLEPEIVIKNGEELESLISTYGGEIIDRIIQKQEKPDPRTYIGRGKIGEIILMMRKKQIDIVVLNAMVKPGQVFNLKKELIKENPQIEVWDRVDLILQIFDKHANTKEAKLQIELARMRYMGPRIYGMGYVLSRQAGGIGTVGVGETNTELMKRHWRHEMKSVTDQLKKLTSERESQIKRRQNQGYKTVSIVGYTNAGKTSLFNFLTKKNNFQENVLFATLDSAVGKIYLKEADKEILITDTIGFIRNLPPRLIDAFKSTLLESIHADLILLVIDVSDQEMDFKIKVVEQVLSEIKIETKKIIYVFNKIDLIKINKTNINSVYSEFSPVFISVKKQKGLDDLIKKIGNELFKN